MTYNHSLRELNLAWTNARDEGSLSVVWHPWLPSTLTGDATVPGGQAFGRCLQSNKHLRSLNLAHNGLRGRAAITLAQSLQVNAALRELVLDGNAFGAAGVRALLRCVISADDDHEDEAATEFDPKRDSVVSASGSSSGKGREDPRSISLVGCNFQVGWRLFCSVLCCCL